MKYLVITLIIITTAVLSLYPDLRYHIDLLDNYTWQMDIVKHAGYYFVLTLAALLIQQKVKPLIMGLGIFSFSIVLEGLQFFSPERSVSWMDVGSNALGVGVACTIYNIYCLNLKKTLIEQIKK